MQPEPHIDVETGLYDCGTWEVSATWEVPKDAVSGIYVARLVRPEPSLTWRADNTQAAANAWMTGAPEVNDKNYFSVSPIISKQPSVSSTGS